MKKLLTMCTLLFCNTMFAPGGNTDMDGATCCCLVSGLLYACVTLCDPETHRTERPKVPPAGKTSSPDRKQKMK